MRQTLRRGGGEHMAALLRRRDFAWINRRVGVVGEEGTALVTVPSFLFAAVEAALSAEGVEAA